ncbi:NAD(P)H-binding protein [Streptomyces sp. ventii]|uniref:NAD(P)H-binding protein n=1 Tax=Streptomyces spiramenti TaxID=2720606 RepID=A0ABX1AJH1_9ACTN|nr:NAD(P)H-binding protein [Streptomyces spiramenti]
MLVVGATGTTGSRLTARLLSGGHAVDAASRSGRSVPGARPVRFVWHDPATHAAALDGADRLYLVPPVGDPGPAAVVLPFLRRARAAGVRRVVLLSSSAVPAGGPAVGEVHAALPGLVPEWAVLRPSWFMQNFLGDHFHARSAREEGVLRTATGEGRVAFVDAGDIAAVAAAVLTAEAPPAGELLLTGAQALSYDRVAEELSRSCGRRVVHERLTVAAMVDRLAAELPRPFAELLASLDSAVARGEEERTTDTVLRLTGRPPRALADVLRDEAAAPPAAGRVRESR